MSTSETTDFDAWLARTFDELGSFTAFVILVEIDGSEVTPLCSTYFHVIGTEIDWPEMTLLLAGSGRDWQGAAFFPDQGGGSGQKGGGALDNVAARVKMKGLEEAVAADRLYINKGHFFDQWGRRMRIDEVSQS